MSKLTAPVLLLLIAFGCGSSCLAQTESWQELTKEGEQALQSERMSEAFKFLKSALEQAEKQKVSPGDSAFRTLMLEDIPNLVEKLSLERNTEKATLEKNKERAEELANAKLATAERMFGSKSPMTLDALQDLQSLYTAQNRNDEMRSVVMRYAGTVTALRDEGKESEVNDVVDYRTARLKRKLRESFERIQKRFVPVNSSAMTSTQDSEKGTATVKSADKPAPDAKAK